MTSGGIIVPLNSRTPTDSSTFVKTRSSFLVLHMGASALVECFVTSLCRKLFVVCLGKKNISHLL